MNIKNIKALIVGAFCLAISLANAQTNDPFSLRKSLGLAQMPAQEANAGSYSVKSDQAPLIEDRAPKPATNTAGDHAANANSEVFGANLFTGAFAKQGPGRFNPDYAIMVGDRIQLRLWGGFDFEGIVEVDPKGNVFLPHVGPIMVLGVKNEALQRVVEGAVRQIFRANVYSYASLAAAQPVRVYVGGFVNRPGLYNGTSLDSLLSYLDQAGGIDVDRGSFLNIEVKRGDRVRASVDLYQFLLQGKIPMVQLAEGDVIFVAQRQSTVRVSGLVASANRFEFANHSRTVADLVKLSRPKPQATHVRVIHNAGTVTNTDYVPLDQASQIVLENGDELEFTADKKPGTITVRVEGEHLSAQEYVLPYGARLGELMSQIKYSERSDSEKPQLFRQSVKARQKQLLSVSLKTLESSVLTARSGTTTEATLRTDEANLILKWVERAKQIEPAGQIVIAQSAQRNDLLLENGDIVKIHAKDGLVLIGGEVLFPNAVAFESRYDLDDYIKVAGGYTQNADTSRIVVAHRDGSFEEGKHAEIVSGDEVLVLPKVDVKSREIAKDLMQMVYQIAIAARVVIGL
jgi:protein involved in polysaccharide export with SLBB domain